MSFVPLIQNASNASVFQKVQCSSITNNLNSPDFDPGCDCDESLPNADSFCPRNQTCKQCKCLAQGGLIESEIHNHLTKLSGCDCDESLPNADSFCGANEKCKNCKCLKKGWFVFFGLVFSKPSSGCDCDDSLPNADDFCSANEECKNCKCLPAGNVCIINGQWLMRPNNDKNSTLNDDNNFYRL